MNAIHLEMGDLAREVKLLGGTPKFQEWILHSRCEFGTQAESAPTASALSGVLRFISSPTELNPKWVGWRTPSNSPPWTILAEHDKTQMLADFCLSLGDPPETPPPGSPPLRRRPGKAPSPQKKTPRRLRKGVRENRHRALARNAWLPIRKTRKKRVETKNTPGILLWAPWQKIASQWKKKHERRAQIGIRCPFLRGSMEKISKIAKAHLLLKEGANIRTSEWISSITLTGLDKEPFGPPHRTPSGRAAPRILARPPSGQKRPHSRLLCMEIHTTHRLKSRKPGENSGISRLPAGTGICPCGKHERKQIIRRSGPTMWVSLRKMGDK